MLLHDMRQRLAEEPFTWTLWWEAGKRWRIDVFITPRLTREQPLWSRDEKSLESLRLCRLRPEELQIELEAYWKKPFWKRWFLALFSRINNKREVWSYYQRCLSFNKVNVQYSSTDSAFQGSEEEQAIFLQLSTWLSQNARQFERILEKHAGDLNWQKNSFTALLSRYEKKTEQRFLKLMDRKLKKLPTEGERNSLRSRIEKRYQALTEVIHDYLVGSLSSQTRISAEPTRLNFVAEAAGQELVYVGPTASVTTLQMSSTETDLADMKSVRAWVTSKQQTIARLLVAEKPEGPYVEIKELLEQSLHSIRGLVELELQGYKWRRVDELLRRQGAVANYQEARSQLEQFKSWQSNLIKFFRSSVLLFHPDKSNGDADLVAIKTELFKQFKQLSDTSLEILNEGLKKLEGGIPEWQVKCQRILKEMRSHHEKFNRELEEKMERIAQDKAEMKAEIEQLRQLVLAQSRSMNLPSEQAGSPDQEKPGTSAHFFARR